MVLDAGRIVSRLRSVHDMPKVLTFVTGGIRQAQRTPQDRGRNVESISRRERREGAFVCHGEWLCLNLRHISCIYDLLLGLWT